MYENAVFTPRLRTDVMGYHCKDYDVVQMQRTLKENKADPRLNFPPHNLRPESKAKTSARNNSEVETLLCSHPDIRKDSSSQDGAEHTGSPLIIVHTVGISPPQLERTHDKYSTGVGDRKQ